MQKVSATEIGTRYDYNELGELVAATDAKGRVTQYEYDDAGRRIAVVLPGGERASTTYDELGNIASYTDFNGETTEYEYDAENRLVVKDLEDDIDVEYSYTEEGQVATIKDSRGKTEFEYDELGYLLWRKDADGPYLASGNTIEYDYDDAGNIVEVRTPSGTVGYSYDSQNRLQKVVEGAEETVYHYDEVGNLIETIFPNGTVETREYDELYRLTNVRVVDRDDALLSEFKYELNEAGHRTQVTEKVRQPDGSLSERTVEYEYDELYRLIEAAVWGGETITYRYDEVGNRISAGARNYVYDDNDRLIEEREGGEVVVEYGYDDNGNLLSRTEGNETVNYIWDDRNRLVTVEENGEVVEFEYDDDNIRVSQTVGGQKTSFLLDKNRPYDQVLAEFVDGEEVASYVYGLDLISQERNGVDSFYFVDGLGSTRGLTDGSGEVTDAYWYDAYGNLLEHEGDSENDYLFAGEQFDEQLGQYYLRQRYYDAATGRFTRRDTWEGRLHEPITLNKYLYANGNPVSYVDPSGLYAIALLDTAVVSALIVSLAYLYYTQARFGGFNALPQTSTDDIFHPYPRDPNASLVSRLLDWRGRGFSAHAELNHPNITFVPPNNTINDLIDYLFSNKTVPEILYPNGKPIGKKGGHKIREVQGDVDNALDMLDEIAKAGGGFTDVTPRGYEGIRIRLPNGEIFGVRDKMTKSPGTNATLDVTAPQSAPTIEKIKFNP